jgi:hypothetical protein
MKRTMMGASLVVLVLIGAVSVMGGQQEQATSQPSMMGRGMMGMPMMGMMCPMMGGQMDPMGMMGGGQMEPKVIGRMLELRGELLKAMGEVMIKHGQAMSKEP